MIKVSDLGEFGLIEKIKKIAPVFSKDIYTSIGDDAAVIRSGNSYQLFTTDTLVENVHFDLKYSKFYELGWKLMAVNISDIASMGGDPKYALVTLGLKQDLSVKSITDLYEGMKALGNKYKVSIIGGDIVKSPRQLFFTMDLIGICKKPILRSGAKIGDLIACVGSFGASAVALENLKRKGRTNINIKPHLMPNPMVKEGKAISRYAHSMIDNSDGLARCIREICGASKVGAIIYQDNIPLASGASISQAFNGGEDYNLIFTIPKNSINRIKGAKVIGEIVKGGIITLKDRSGHERILSEKGFEHV